MGYTKKTTHAAEMIGNELLQDKEQPNRVALIESIGAEIQDAENSLGDVFDQHFIDNAVGAQLDGLGEIVDEDRKGKADPEYRTVLKAKDRALRSNGSPEDLIAVVRLVISAVAFALEEMFPAHVKISMEVNGLDAPEIATLLSLARPAGVSGALIADTTATPFQFSSTAALEPSVTQGFSQNAQTTGGDLSAVFAF